MNSKILALSVALAATTAAASVAEAGGGIRLNLGLPLGNFTATPSQGGNHQGKRHVKRKPAPEYTRRTPSSRPTQVAKPAPAPDTEKDKQGSTTDTATESTESSAAPSGSTALIETSPSPVTQDTGSDSGSDTAAKSEPAAEEPASEPAKDTAAVADDASKTDAGETDEAKSDETSDETKVTDVGCKKFIPAIGLMVTVDCKDKE